MLVCKRLVSALTFRGNQHSVAGYIPLTAGSTLNIGPFHPSVIWLVKAGLFVVVVVAVVFADADVVAVVKVDCLFKNSELLPCLPSSPSILSSPDKLAKVLVGFEVLESAADRLKATFCLLVVS